MSLNNSTPVAQAGPVCEGHWLCHLKMIPLALWYDIAHPADLKDMMIQDHCRKFLFILHAEVFRAQNLHYMIQHQASLQPTFLVELPSRRSCSRLALAIQAVAGDAAAVGHRTNVQLLHARHKLIPAD